MGKKLLVTALLFFICQSAIAETMEYCLDKASVMNALNESSCKHTKVGDWDVFCNDSIHLNPFSDFLDDKLRFEGANINDGSMFGTFKHTGIVCTYSDRISSRDTKTAYAMKGVAKQFKPDTAGDWSGYACVPGLKIKSKSTFVQDVIFFVSGFISQVAGNQSSSKIDNQLNSQDSDQKAISRCGFISR